MGFLTEMFALNRWYVRQVRLYKSWEEITLYNKDYTVTEKLMYVQHYVSGKDFPTILMSAHWPCRCFTINIKQM